MSEYQRQQRILTAIWEVILALFQFLFWVFLLVGILVLLGLMIGLIIKTAMWVAK